MYRSKQIKTVVSVSAVFAALLLFNVQPSMAVYFAAPDAYWQLEETNPGSGIVSDTGTVNGTCTSCPTSVDPAQIGSGFAFSGDSINFADNAIFDFAAAGSFSIELWMKIASIPTSRQVMISRYDGVNSTHWWLSVENDGKVGAYFTDSDGPGATTIKTSAGVTDNAWHHVVAVRDGATDRILLYVDGVLDTASDQSANTSTDGSFASDAAVVLGNHILGGTYAFAGALDNVAIYSSTALPASVILQNYLNGSLGKDLDEEFAPVFTGGDQSSSAAVGYALTLSAWAAGNPLPTYSSANLPSGASIDNSTGVITWLPSDLHEGANTFAVTASNSSGNGSQNWTIQVIDLCESALQGFWKLEEATAPYLDEKAMVEDATCTNCPTQEDGQVGFAQAFNNATITIPANPVFDWAAGSSFSIEFWMKAASNPGSRQILIGRIDGINSTHWWLSLEPTGVIAAYFTDSDGPGAANFRGTNDVADNNWHHVAAVVDAAATRILLYIDGVLEASQSQSSSNNGSFISTANVTLGNHGLIGYAFEGSIDEVALYNLALTAAMVEQHANLEADRSYCNEKPTITGQPGLTATEGQPYTYNATATDPENDAITWSLTVSPTGMAIDANSGAVTWTPGDGITSANVTVVATDAFGGTASQAYTIAVTPVDNPDDGGGTPDDGGDGGGSPDTGATSSGGGGGGGCFIETLIVR